MKSASAAIVLLASGVFFAGGAIAETLMVAASKADGSIPGRLSMIAGVVLGLVGLVLLVTASLGRSSEESR